MRCAKEYISVVEMFLGPDQRKSLLPLGFTFIGD
jgi:hypothetical protein